MEDLNPATLWAAVGLALVLAELLVGSFVLLFFGVGALVVAGLLALGLPLPLGWQLVVAAGCSVGSLQLFRDRILRIRGSQPPAYNPVAGQPATLLQAIGPGQRGRLQFRGTQWDGLNTGTHTLPQGSTVLLKEQQGDLLLF